MHMLIVCAQTLEAKLVAADELPSKRGDADLFVTPSADAATGSTTWSIESRRQYIEYYASFDFLLPKFESNEE